MDVKECPLCNEMMKIVVRELVDRVPGSPQEIRTKVREWVCSECDYFEEAEERDAQAANERPA